ncbi:unnamed protein product [Urochloa humidicola]
MAPPRAAAPPPVRRDGAVHCASPATTPPRTASPVATGCHPPLGSPRRRFLSEAAPPLVAAARGAFLLTDNCTTPPVAAPHRATAPPEECRRRHPLRLHGLPCPHRVAALPWSTAPRRLPSLLNGPPRQPPPPTLAAPAPAAGARHPVWRGVSRRGARIEPRPPGSCTVCGGMFEHQPGRRSLRRPRRPHHVVQAKLDKLGPRSPPTSLRARPPAHVEPVNSHRPLHRPAARARKRLSAVPRTPSSKLLPSCRRADASNGFHVGCLLLKRQWKEASRATLWSLLSCLSG